MTAKASNHAVSLNSTEFLPYSHSSSQKQNVSRSNTNSSSSKTNCNKRGGIRPSSQSKQETTSSSSRHSSTKRKPVPSYLPMPANLSIPANHPFATDLPGNISGSGPPSIVHTPTSVNEGDLFFAVPKRTGPLPPRRPSPRAPGRDKGNSSGSPAGSIGTRGSTIGGGSGNGSKEASLRTVSIKSTGSSLELPKDLSVSMDKRDEKDEARGDREILAGEVDMNEVILVDERDLSDASEVASRISWMPMDNIPPRSSSLQVNVNNESSPPSAPARPIRNEARLTPPNTSSSQITNSSEHRINGDVVSGNQLKRDEVTKTEAAILDVKELVRQSKELDSRPGSPGTVGGSVNQPRRRSTVIWRPPPDTSRSGKISSSSRPGSRPSSADKSKALNSGNIPSSRLSTSNTKISSNAISSSQSQSQSQSTTSPNITQNPNINDIQSDIQSNPNHIPKPTQLQHQHQHLPSQPSQPSQPKRRRSSLPLLSEADLLAEQTDDIFTVDQPPSKRKIWEAGTCFLRDEEGKLVCFGDLFPRWPGEKHLGQMPKTVVFFIRHFWCGQCQDFMFASLSLLDPEALKKANVRVVVISNGSWKIIKAYKKLFDCPFPIYVDGPRKLYSLMGMTKMTNDFGPMFKGRAAYHQRPVPTQLLHGLGNAFTKMPLAYPGKLTQLGGEFIFSPGYNCEFAHRMTNTSNHMEAPDVLRAAGVLAPTKNEVSEIKLHESQIQELERLQAEAQEWRTRREAELERIRMKKARRRGEEYKPLGRVSRLGLGLDEELGEGYLGDDGVWVSGSRGRSRSGSVTPTPRGGGSTPLARVEPTMKRLGGDGVPDVPQSVYNDQEEEEIFIHNDDDEEEDDIEKDGTQDRVDRDEGDRNGEREAVEEAESDHEAEGREDDYAHELEKRFHEVMLLEEQREKEHALAVELADSRKKDDLDLKV